ncbi:hypothetical protein Pres01_17470 [Metapseudomonas resinovorans]|nr:hypothetical protein Pres01_17470 [Pseudomonas resinovorans]
MVVTGRYIAAPPVHDKAGQGQAGPHFEDALTFQFHRQHGVRQDMPGRPDLTEQGPAFRGYPEMLSLKFGIVILLMVE